tara:strand:+ start:595 stop:1872 length:1278 start_codon:yes stop_codon:yes gene_type:complete
MNFLGYNLVKHDFFEIETPIVLKMANQVYGNKLINKENVQSSLVNNYISKTHAIDYKDYEKQKKKIEIYKLFYEFNYQNYILCERGFYIFNKSYIWEKNMILQHGSSTCEITTNNTIRNIRMYIKHIYDDIVLYNTNIKKYFRRNKFLLFENHTNKKVSVISDPCKQLITHPIMYLNDPWMFFFYYYDIKCVNYFEKENVPNLINSYVISFYDINRSLVPKPFYPVTIIKPNNIEKLSDTLSIGETNYIYNYKKILQSITGVTAIFDDDVRFSKFFHLHWLDICQKNLLQKNVGSGGILLLGTSIWNDSVYSSIKSEKYNTVELANITTGVFGSFSIIWSVNAAKVAVSVLDKLQYAHPLDHIFPLLHGMGIPVQFLKSPIVIMDVFKNSSLDMLRPKGLRRHALHHWGSSSRYYKNIRVFKTEL